MKKNAKGFKPVINRSSRLYSMDKPSIYADIISAYSLAVYLFLSIRCNQIPGVCKMTQFRVSVNNVAIFWYIEQFRFCRKLILWSTLFRFQCSRSVYWSATMLQTTLKHFLLLYFAFCNLEKVNTIYSHRTMCIWRNGI